jgi:hypothetical protein
VPRPTRRPASNDGADRFVSGWVGEHRMFTIPSYATALPPAPSRRSAVRSHLLPVTRRNLHCVALDMRYPPIWAAVPASVWPSLSRPNG